MLGNADHIILCASANRLTAGLWHGKKLQSFSDFLNNESEQKAFADYLRRNNQINISLIVDSVEEEYRVETLPHTTGKARAEILSRKLNQHNRNSVFRAAKLIGRDKDKRKDDHFLFTSLNNIDFLEGWLEAIETSQAPLVGVYLLPMLSQHLAKQLKINATDVLMCERLSSGLRQTYLQNGQVRMSRLVSMEAVKPEQNAYFYLVETDKTRLYLISQRFIAPETKLQLVIPSLDASNKDIASAISQEQEIECITPSLSQQAAQIGQPLAVLQQHPELLHMQLLAAGAQPDNLAPQTFTKTFEVNKLRQSFFMATAVVLICGVLFSLFRLWQTKSLNLAAENFVQQTKQQQNQYDQVAKNFPVIPIASQDLKVAVELGATIKANSKTPEQMMVVVSKALEVSPEIQLDRIRWVLSSDLDVKDEQQQTTSLNTQANQSQLMEVGFVNARIDRFDGDYRGAITSVYRLVNKIRENNQVAEVTIVQEPVNVSSLASLQGSTIDENKNERPPAIFKLKIVLKPGGGAI